MKLVIYSEIGEKRRFPQLENLTGVPLNTWRSWWRNGTNPSGALAEAVAKQWPQYAFWLATGLTDIACGHRRPPLHPAAQGYIRSWPEEGSVAEKTITTTYSREYFAVATRLHNDDRSDGAGTADVLAHSLKYVRQKRLEEINRNWKFEPIATQTDLI
ncbi:hypothetical protein [Variovorax sp. ZT4R33]|uniref:hypothetical protein n=1 Tax=Variovorax sp. ZT4R33 TaxID=3443743 RepID=UPI003F486EAE